MQFFLLGPYVAAEAIHTLVTGDQPETSWLGIGLVASSVIGMPFLRIAKDVGEGLPWIAWVER